MQINVLDYLERTVKRLPNKVAFADKDGKLTFLEIYDHSQRVGSSLAKYNVERKPVVVFMKKSPEEIAAFLGVIYAGGYYVPIDEDMPKRRIELILENVNADCLIYDDSVLKSVNSLKFKGTILKYDDCINVNIDDVSLRRIRNSSQDLDPIYVLFTSGSTGVPKGVVGHHRAVIDYIESLSETLGFNEETIFGNQTPFYLDACMKEIYPTLKYGATTYIVPKELFMFPVKLVEYLNNHKVNTICWVVSALTMISAFSTFDIVRPQYLRVIAFGSEVFPIKQFNIWKNNIPNAEFYNLYGPTEATGMSCYYHATRLFEENETIPIGRPFKNTRILLLGEDDKEVMKGQTGEICILGTCITHGYYNNLEKTVESFTQNPTNHNYQEKMYRTGDIGKYDDVGNLVFVSRKDHQIKHMGHRIELGEIESDASSVEGVVSCCCVYIKDVDKIALFYVGDISKADLTVQLKDRLPRYMIPNSIIPVDSIPLTSNGKKDRKLLEGMYIEMKSII